MDETRDGVRQQLRAVIQETAERRHAELEAASSTDFADAILARFEVTPKSAVTLDELGRMVIGAYQGPTFDMTMIPAYSARSAGQRMVDQLAQHGLAIVRANEVTQ